MKLTSAVWNVWVLCASLACVGVATAGLARAQEPPGTSPQASGQVRSDVELTRAVVQTQRQAIVTNAVELTEAESRAFWPLYREYHADRAQIRDRVAELVTDYAERYPNVTSDEAEGMLDAYLDAKMEELKLKQRYLPKFRKVLPALKVTRYYQVENKLDVAIDLQLARSIPLIW